MYSVRFCRVEEKFPLHSKQLRFLITSHATGVPYILYMIVETTVEFEQLARGRLGGMVTVANCAKYEFARNPAINVTNTNA